MSSRVSVYHMFFLLVLKQFVYSSSDEKFLNLITREGLDVMVKNSWFKHVLW